MIENTEFSVPTKTVIETRRLVLRHLSLGDSAFMVGLLNDPDFLRYIGDKGVRTIADAGVYLLNGPIASYRQHGFGLYFVAIRDSGAGAGICGIVKRDGLDAPDIGFAFLPAFRGMGYAAEAARAIREHGEKTLDLKCLLAITSLDNHASIRVLEKIGFTFDRIIQFPDRTEELRLFRSDR